MRKLINWNDERVTKEAEKYAKMSGGKLKLLTDVISVMEVGGFKEFMPNCEFLDMVITEFNDPDFSGCEFNVDITPCAYFMRKEDDKIVVALISTDFDTHQWYDINIVTIAPSDNIEYKKEVC